MNCKIFRIKNGQIRQVRMSPERLIDKIVANARYINTLLFEVSDRIIYLANDETWQGLENDENRVG